MAGKAVPVVVDLTLSDTSSSDDTSMADVSALRASAQKTTSRFQNAGGSGFTPARHSDKSLEVHLPARTAAPPGKVNTASGPSPGSSATATAITNTSSRIDTTPSRPGRTSILDEIRDSQSPTPPFQTPPIPRALSPPLHHFRNSHQTPKQPSMTPRRPEWTVDKIVTTLSALALQVGQDHARLVEYELQEAEKKAPEPKHITSFDDFADMKHIALEPGTRPPPGVATMGIKFKVGSNLTLLTVPRADSPKSNIVGSIATSPRLMASALNSPQSPSRPTKRVFRGTGFIMSRSRRTFLLPIPC